MKKEFICKFNNQKIYGILFLPEHIDKKIPIIILSHGLSLDHSLMIPYAEKLLKHDIASYVFDFRGGGYESKSDGKISDMSIITEKDDLNCVIDNIKELDYVDSDKIYLAGHSQGGLVSSLVANDRPEDIEALFLFAPAYIIPDDMKELDNPREKNVINIMPEYTGQTYIDGANSINLYDDILNFKKEVYIFHGKLDSRVYLKYSIEANQLYENCTLVVFDNEEHRFTDDTKNIVVEKISKILEK